MDSSGLRVLLTARNGSTAGIHVACKPDGAIHRLFDIALAGAALQVFESREDALDAF